MRRTRRDGDAPQSHKMQTYSEVAIGTAALGQSLANVVHEVFLAGASGRADGLLLELDLRHDERWRAARWAQWVVKVRSWVVVVVVVTAVEDWRRGE